MKSGWLAVPLVLASCVLPGPRSQDSDLATYDLQGLLGEPADREPPGYFEARLLDLMDILSVQVSPGPGLGARLAATKLVQIAWMWRGPAEPYGELGRWPNLTFGNTGRNWGAWDLRSYEYGLSLWYHYDEDVLEPGLPPHRWRGGYEERGASAIEASVHLALVGATVSFDPLELFDFLGGILGFGEAGWFD